MVIHQSGALVGFLQHGINDDALGDVFQFHDGQAHHEGNTPGACDRQDWLGIHTSRIRDDRPGSSNRDVRIGVGIEERIAAEVDRKGTVRIAPEHLFKRDLVGNPRSIVAASPVGKGHGAAALQPGGDGYDLGRVEDRDGGCRQKIAIYEQAPITQILP